MSATHQSATSLRYLEEASVESVGGWVKPLKYLLLMQMGDRCSVAAWLRVSGTFSGCWCLDSHGPWRFGDLAAAALKAIHLQLRLCQW